MNIGIIGAENIGASAARLFADADHVVAISNSRGPESLASLVEEIGPNACCYRRRCGFLRRGRAGGDPVLAL
jgi:predicted dinucleotide-binding enzyme